MSPKRRRRDLAERRQSGGLQSKDDFAYYSEKRRDRLLVQRLRREVAKLRRKESSSEDDEEEVKQVEEDAGRGRKRKGKKRDSDLAEVKHILEDLRRELGEVKKQSGLKDAYEAGIDVEMLEQFAANRRVKGSKKDRMARRSRQRRARATRELKEYEEKLRRAALLDEEMAYKREKERKARVKKRKEEQKRERMEQLQKEFQEEWAAALASQQDSIVPMRSRPIVTSSFASDPFVSSAHAVVASPTAVKREGMIHITFQEIYVHQKESGKFVVRTSLLPWGDMAIVRLEEFSPGHRCSFSYRGKPPSRVIPALRLELHKQTGKSGVMVGAAELYLTKYLDDPHVETQEQVALSNGTGIVNLILRFENVRAVDSPHRALSPQSRLAYALPGQIRVRLLEGRDLHFGNWADATVKVNLKVSFTLKPWGTVVDSKTIQNTGPNPQWRSKDALLDFDYPGAPPRGLPPALIIRAFNVSKTSQVELGSAELPLTNLVSLQFEAQNSKVDLTSSSGLMAGTLFFQVGFAASDARAPTSDVIYPSQPLFPTKPQGKTKRHQFRQAIKDRPRQVVPSSPRAMPIVVDSTNDFWMKKPSEQDLRLMSQTGELRVHLLEANNLRKIHTLMYQNIVVSAVLRPWGQSYRCKAKHDGGHNHAWTQESGVFYIDYPGTPSDNDWPMIEFEILYSSLIKEKVVARARIGLFEFLSKSANDKGLVQECTIFLKDKTGEAAGSLTLSLSWNTARSPLNSPKIDTTLRVTAGPFAADKKNSPNAEDPKALSLVGTLKVRAIAGHHLKHVQRIGWQDPYVSVTLLPWGERSRCKTHPSGGSDPRWNGTDGEMVFSYPGAAENGTLPTLRIEVYDAEAVMKDRLIGHCEYPLVEFIPNEETAIERVVNMHLKDTSGLNAGTLDLGLKWVEFERQDHFASHDTHAYATNEATKGKLRITIQNATNLKSVQVLGKQDPYVEATLLPDKVTKRTKTMWKGGTQPQWDKVAGALAFDVNVKAGDPPQKLMLQVKDAEHVFQDRNIGVGHLELERYIAASCEDKPVSIPLFDASGSNAGALNIKLTFVKTSTAEEDKRRKKQEELLRLTGFLRVRRVHLTLNDQVVDVLDSKVASLVARLEPWESQAGFELGLDKKAQNQITIEYGGALPKVEALPRLVVHAKVNGTAASASCDLRQFLEEQIEEERLFEATMYLDGSKKSVKCGKLKFSISFLHKLDEPIQRFNKITAFVEKAYGLRQIGYLRWKAPKPYVKLTLLESETSVRSKTFSSSCKGKEEKTKQKQKDPVWNSHLELVAQNHDAKLQIEVLDDNTPLVGKDRLIGLSIVDLDQDPPPNDIELKDRKGRRAGTLSIKLDWQKRKQKSCEAWVRVVVHDAQDLLPYNFDLDRHECTLSLRPHGPFICKIPGIVSNGKVVWETQPRELWSAGGGLEDIRAQSLHLLISVDKIGVVGELNLDLSLVPVWPASKARDYLKQCTRWYPVEARDMNVDINPQLQMSVLVLRKDDLRDLRKSSAATLIQSLRRGQSSRKVSKFLRKSRHEMDQLDDLAMNALVRATKNNQEQAKAALNIQRIVRGGMVRKKINFHRAVRILMRVQRMIKQRKVRWRRKIIEGKLVVKVVRAWGLRNANLIAKQDPYLRLTLDPGHILQCTKPVKNGGRSPTWDEEKHESMAVFDVGSHPLQTTYGGPLKLSLELFTKHTLGIASDLFIGKCTLMDEVIEIMKASSEPLKEKCIHAVLKDKKDKKEVGTVELFIYWTRKVFTGLDDAAVDHPRVLKRSTLTKEIRLAHEHAETLSVQAKERQNAARNPALAAIDRTRLKEEALQLEQMANDELRRAAALERLYVGQGFVEAGGPKKDLVGASVDVQRFYRGSALRNKLYRKKSDRASTKLQAQIRGKHARKEFARLRKASNASETVQRVYRGSKVRKNYRWMQDKRRRASVELQRIYRGKKARNSFLARQQEVDRLFGKGGDSDVQVPAKGNKSQKELVDLLDEDTNEPLAQESAGEDDAETGNEFLNQVLYEEHKARDAGVGVVNGNIVANESLDVLHVRLIGDIVFATEAAQREYKPSLKLTLFPGGAESHLTPVHGSAGSGTVLALPEERDDTLWPR